VIDENFVREQDAVRQKPKNCIEAEGTGAAGDFCGWSFRIFDYHFG